MLFEFGFGDKLNIKCSVEQGLNFHGRPAGKAGERANSAFDSQSNPSASSVMEEIAVGSS